MQDIALRDRVRAAETEIANGHPDQALAHCQALQARYPQALIVQRLLGEIYLALNRSAEALRTMEWVIAADPDDARACCALAIAEQMRGDSQAALAWYRRACEVRPEDNMLRQAYRELAATRRQPPYRLSSAGLARLYLRGDLLLHAQTEWEAVLAQHPDQLDALVGLAETFWRSGQAEHAQVLAQQVIDRTPLCVRALLILSAIDHAAGHDDEARARMQIVADLDPEQRIGHALFAEQLAAGDEGLSALLLTPPSGVAAHINDSLVNGFSSGRMRGISNTDVMRAQQAGARPGVLPPAAQEDLDAVSSFGQKRNMPIPDDFHSIFAETEFMLWGREEDEAGPTPAAQATSKGYSPPSSPLAGAELPRLGRMERSGPTAPPPVHAPDSNLEDTESRAAIGWIRWLQAQGARPLETPMAHPAASAPQAEPAPRPFQEPLVAPAPTGEPAVDESPFAEPAVLAPSVDVSEVPDTTGEQLWTAPKPQARESEWQDVPDSGLAEPAMHDGWTGDLPPNVPDAIEADSVMRDEGAPLPEYETPRQAEPPLPYAGAGDEVMSDMAVGNMLWPSDAPAQPETWPGANADVSPSGTAAEEYAAWQDINASEAYEAHDAQDSAALDESDYAPIAQDGAGDYAIEPEPSDGITTLDALEAVDRNAGFAPYDPHPGELAALTGVRDGASIDLFSETSDAPDTYETPTPELAADEAYNDVAEASAANADDADGRLRQARAWHAQGQLDDALGLYGALLQQSPAHLDEVTRDLQEIVAGTDAPSAHRLLGDAYIRGGNYQQALAEYNHANTAVQSQE